MSNLQEKFTDAVSKSKSLPSQSNDTLLKLYALFKQVNSGDVSGKRPGAFDLKGRAKYDAWSQLKGKSKDEAMEEYINLVTSLAK